MILLDMQEEELRSMLFFISGWYKRDFTEAFDAAVGALDILSPSR